MQWPHFLRSLANRNLRLFFAGQTVSLAGTWVQSTAQAWLVYRLTRSSQMLGLIGFLSQVPVAVFGIYAGSLADRLPRRRVILATQMNATAQAAILAALTLTGAVRPWHLLALAAMLGMSYAFEIPARQALLGDIAGPDMPNAIALNSSVVNAARAVGPALAGWAVAAVGEGWCFAANAVSFLGTIAALVVMEVPVQAVHRGSRRDHLLEGVAYAVRTPHVRALLGLMGVSSFFGLSYATLLPIFAADVLRGGAPLFGALQACAGVGALAGAFGLLTRSGLRGLGRRVGLGATMLGGGLVVLSLSRTPLLSFLALLAVGWGYITQAAGTNTLLQGLAPADLRGRVMGLFSTLFVGATPFGALACGFAAHRFGAPRTLGAGGAVVLLASLAFYLALPRLRQAVVARYPALFPPTVPS